MEGRIIVGPEDQCLCVSGGAEATRGCNDEVEAEDEAEAEEAFDEIGEDDFASATFVKDEDVADTDEVALAETEATFAGAASAYCSAAVPVATLVTKGERTGAGGA